MSDIKIVMTLLVRDEQDIIADNIEFHRSLGVDHFIVTDNLSTDGTPDILEEYCNSGIATVIREEEDTYSQSDWVTRMAHMACEQSIDADWIIHSDADEFWLPDDGDLKSYFANLPENVNIVSAARHDFVGVRDDNRVWYEKMIYRKNLSLSFSGKIIPPVVAHKACQGVLVKQGNHKVLGIPEAQETSEGIEVLHFPIRSLRQYENKIRLGGAAYQRNSSKRGGQRWRSQYVELVAQGTLADFFMENSADKAQIRTLLKDELRVDERLVDHFRQQSVAA